jgi:hypothetical protein
MTILGSSQYIYRLTIQNINLLKEKEYSYLFTSSLLQERTEWDHEITVVKCVKIKT